jgi:hypothetical protein
MNDDEGGGILPIRNPQEVCIVKGKATTGFAVVHVHRAKCPNKKLLVRPLRQTSSCLLYININMQIPCIYVRQCTSIVKLENDAVDWFM